MIVVDGDAGTAVLDPSAGTLVVARAAQRLRLAERRRALADRELPAVTRDGRRVRVLVNAATVPELEAGLAAGAEGVGLMRTELGFLDAASLARRGGAPTAAEAGARAARRPHRDRPRARLRR